MNGRTGGAEGWKPTPFREFVLKVHQRCNLACDYCYVYTMADQSWRHRPRVMTLDVARAAGRRIAAHARDHGIRRVRVVLHGGEPLLAGPDHLARVVEAVREALGSVAEARFTAQTNATLLDDRMLAVLDSLRVRVGVSLDGNPVDHDRRRVYADGRGSYAGVESGLRRLTAPEHRRMFAGLLCTVDPTYDPVATYEALLEWRPPVIDLLLPHANWETAPPRPPVEYGHWLARAFDRWHDAPAAETRVRLFDEIVQLELGGASRSDQVGLSPSAVLVVETDGALEQADSLKSAYPGAAATGLSVLRDPLDAALHHPGIVARQVGPAALAPSCHDCPELAVCGGGHYAHRYRPGSGFRNPSVYCDALQYLIGHIRGRIADDLTPVV